MSRFTVLDAADSVQYRKWVDIWASWKDREVFAHPEYVKMMKRACDLALCFVLEATDGMVLLPMILRPLSAEIWAGNSNEHRDIVTPYGFGGPYAIGFPDIADFWKCLTHWAKDNKVICGFFRLSPFSSNIKPFVDQVETRGGNVIRSLSEGEDIIWNDYKKSVRRDVKRAERMGLKVEVDEQGKRIQDFLRLYYGTMKRRNALPQYFFPEQFFYSLFGKIHGAATLFHVLYGNTVVSSDLVLVGGETLYSFLGGNDESYVGLNSGELLSHYIIIWGIERGKKSYVLGGGYEGYDGIFQFKKKFSPNGIVPFEVGKHIFNQSMHAAMCEKRKVYAKQQGLDWASNSSYFPSYRAKYD